jgi:hypothetical protein
VVCVRFPDIPVIVTVAGPPVGAELLAEKVTTLVLLVVAGLNAAVTPLGRPLAESVTLPLKPLAGIAVMVLVVLAPCFTLTLPGAADKE